jgi:hypothetical protein
MGFLNPWQLWAGLGAAGVAVPILIHLLYRQHRQLTKWAAMELLRRTLVVRSGQVKLEDYLVLFLRCLALMLIAAALLRPTLHSDSAQWLGKKRVGMVVAIDASFSMSHGEFSRFEMAVNKARKILETAKQGDPVSLVLMSNRPEILLRRTGYDPSVFNGLLDKLKAPKPFRLSLDRNLELIEELTSELKTPGRECFLITDAQEQDWGDLTDRTRETLTRLSRDYNVFIVPLAVEGEDNLSLTQLTYASGSLQQRGVARFLATVRNEGRRQTDGGSVEFYVGDALVTRQAVGALEPGQTRGVSFFTSFEAPGDVRLKAVLTKDELNRDNERFAVVQIRPSISVLCVDDVSQSAEKSRAGKYYAVRALRLRGRDEEGTMRVNQVQAPDLSLEDLSDYDLILMANVADLAPELVQRIDRFVRRGGGLILFLGDRVTGDLYNKRFGTGDKGLLPGELGEMVQTDEESKGWSLAPIRSKHPLASMAERLPQEILDSARIRAVVSVKPTQESMTILRITEQNLPLLLQRNVGAGAVLMFTTSADRAWSELPIHPLYTMLLQQAATHLTSHRDARQIYVGEKSEVPLTGRQVGDRVQVIDPQGQSTELKVTQSGQQPICAIDAEKVGIYEIAPADGSPSVTLAANVDPMESNVRVVEASILSQTLELTGATVVSQAGALATAIEQSRQGRELAGLLLMCGIAVFILQSLLARYFTNRMSKPDHDVAESLQKSRVAAARRS